ncbi:MAG: tRNA glutamyl-Q(34) synthetase GluQRS [Geobacteraceae bacterium]|nr:tRNA glutamyl-Q(34) synthetase GluQRS [Geobacteraceae bacterium]
MIATGHCDSNRTVGRFAPSPTGPLHLGSLVAALGSYAMAKREGGLWLLRIEDLDSPRVVPGMTDDIFRTLETLGFQWDGEVLFQSRRADVYRESLDRLLREGAAYPCGCSRSEIARIATAPHSGDEEPVYPGMCRAGLPEGKAARSVRVRVGDETISFHDGIMGPVSRTLSASGGDFVIKRADGPFAYQLAVVVDDAESGVNQVVRGADLLSSTPRQIHLQRLLGCATPCYYHLPLVTGPGGGKLSKRDNAVSLAAGRDLVREGNRLLFDALRFLGQEPPSDLCGASCGELLQWAVDFFAPETVPRIPGQFPSRSRDPGRGGE